MLPTGSTSRPLLLLSALVLATAAGCGDTSDNPTGTAGTTSSTAGTASGGSAGAGVGGSMAGGSGSAVGGTLAGGGAGGATAGGGAGGMAGMAGGNTMPTMLSETGLFSDIKSKTLATGVYKFTPAYKLWSDGADKQRYVYMPAGAKITTDNMEFWQYPGGFKLWKDFTRDGKLIETRLLMKLSNGAADWYMVAFKWKDDYSDAVALPAGEMNAMGTMHDIPSKEQCKGCHSSMKDNALGFTAAMLSHSLPDSLNLTQIDTMGWLSTPIKAGGYPLPGNDTEKAALGYLHANCGMCHNNRSQVYNTAVSLDLWTHLDKIATVPETFAYLSTVCDQWPGPNGETDKFSTITSCAAGHATGAPMAKPDISKPKRIVPIKPVDSGIHDLMSLRATGQVGEMKQMPPLGSEIIDPTGLGAVDAWINSLPAQ
jgi:hypothetical protein